MSTSRFGDAEWGEQFEHDDDPLVTMGQADGDGYGDTSYLDEEFVASEVSAQSAADAAQETLENQRSNHSFVSSDEDADLELSGLGTSGVAGEQTALATPATQHITGRVHSG